MIDLITRLFLPLPLEGEENRKSFMDQKIQGGGEKQNQKQFVFKLISSLRALFFVLFLFDSENFSLLNWVLGILFEMKYDKSLERIFIHFINLLQIHFSFNS